LAENDHLIECITLAAAQFPFEIELASQAEAAGP
jgi:hypothetical protein